MFSDVLIWCPENKDWKWSQFGTATTKTLQLSSNLCFSCSHNFIWWFFRKVLQSIHFGWNLETRINFKMVKQQNFIRKAMTQFFLYKLSRRAHFGMINGLIFQWRSSIDFFQLKFFDFCSVNKVVLIGRKLRLILSFYQYSKSYYSAAFLRYDTASTSLVKTQLKPIVLQNYIMKN